MSSGGDTYDYKYVTWATPDTPVSICIIEKENEINTRFCSFLIHISLTRLMSQTFGVSNLDLCYNQTI